MQTFTVSISGLLSDGTQWASRVTAVFWVSIETLRCWEESQRRRRREAATGAQPLVVQAMSTDLEQKADIQLKAACLAFSAIERH